MRKGSVEINWDSMSQAYEAFTNNEDSYSFSLEWPSIKRMLPDLRDKSVLDLGCGTGRFSFLFEKDDVDRVVGIDISSGMLEIAGKVAEKNGSNVEFVHKDISKYVHETKSKFDLIFSSTTLHYIEDLDHLFKGIHNLLNENGTCIISVIHPVYSAHYPVMENDHFPSDGDWKIKYLDRTTRAYVQPWIEYNDDIDNYLSMSHHHTMSDYLCATLKNGLQLVDFDEPLPPKEWKVKYPGRYQACMDNPTFMIMKLSK